MLQFCTVAAHVCISPFLLYELAVDSAVYMSSLSPVSTTYQIQVHQHPQIMSLLQRCMQMLVSSNPAPHTLSLSTHSHPYTYIYSIFSLWIRWLPVTNHYTFVCCSTVTLTSSLNAYLLIYYYLRNYISPLPSHNLTYISPQHIHSLTLSLSISHSPSYISQ